MMKEDDQRAVVTMSCPKQPKVGSTDANGTQLFSPPQGQQQQLQQQGRGKQVSSCAATATAMGQLPQILQAHSMTPQNSMSVGPDGRDSTDASSVNAVDAQCCPAPSMLTLLVLVLAKIAVPPCSATAAAQHASPAAAKYSMSCSCGGPRPHRKCVASPTRLRGTTSQMMSPPFNSSNRVSSRVNNQDQHQQYDQQMHQHHQQMQQMQQHQQYRCPVYNATPPRAPPIFQPNSCRGKFMKSRYFTWCTLFCVPFAAAAADSSRSRRLRQQYMLRRNGGRVVVVVVQLLRHWRCGSSLTVR
jgi:hypothetical protein